MQKVSTNFRACNSFAGIRAKLLRDCNAAIRACAKHSWEARTPILPQLWRSDTQMRRRPLVAAAWLAAGVSESSERPHGRNSQAFTAALTRADHRYLTQAPTGLARVCCMCYRARATGHLHAQVLCANLCIDCALQLPRHSKELFPPQEFLCLPLCGRCRYC